MESRRCNDVGSGWTVVKRRFSICICSCMVSFRMFIIKNRTKNGPLLPSLLGLVLLSSFFPSCSVLLLFQELCLFNDPLGAPPASLSCDVYNFIPCLQNSLGPRRCQQSQKRSDMKLPVLGTRCLPDESLTWSSRDDSLWKEWETRGGWDEKSLPSQFCWAPQNLTCIFFLSLFPIRRQAFACYYTRSFLTANFNGDVS